MGQNSSTQRRPDADARRVPHIRSLRSLGRSELTPTSRAAQEEGSQSLLGSRSLRLRAGGRARERSRLPAPTAVFRRQTSARSTPAQQPEVDERAPSPQDAVVYEHEERPLMALEDIRIGDAPISNITATPMPRSPSVIARIGSRLSQRYSSVEPGALELDEEGSTWAQAGSESPQLEDHNETFFRSPRRRSMFGSIVDSMGSPSARARRRLSSMSGSMADAAPYEPLSATRSSPLPEPGMDVEGLAAQSPSRLSRVRRSMTGPLEAWLGRANGERQGASSDGSPPPPRARLTDPPPPDETEQLLPPSLPPINLSAAIDLEDRQGRSEHRILEGRADTPIPEPTSRSSWAERLAARTPTIRREPRRVPNLLRGRSSRLIRRDDEMPLSRILQTAAATIAAQLSGNSDALANLEAVGDEPFEGGLNTFMDDLTSAAGSSQANQDASGEGSFPAPLNFWRAFRFMGSGGSRSVANGDDSDGRTVTLVVVGVRSVPSSSLRDPNEGNEANLDSILGDMRTSQRRGFLRSLSGRSLTRSRPSSISGPDLFPAPYESQRHSRTERRSRVEPTSSETEADATLSPRPPPTTPAELHSASAQSTPLPRSRRASIISASDYHTPSEAASNPLDSSNSSTRSHPARRAPTPGQGPIIHAYGDPPIDLDTIPDPPPVRRRRRSDSELARAENLAAHRNGTIDPDGGPLMGRSWLIYVVGTNLPADHPIFLVPSLLSDNPTYEDMLTLSNLLGPVRPPVATPTDVARAGGLFTLQASPGPDAALVAVPTESAGAEAPSFALAATDTCLVCLNAYAARDEIRALAKCDHRFHRACIDEWLTTGRNSCPLCRAAGVPREEGETPVGESGGAETAG